MSGILVDFQDTFQKVREIEALSVKVKNIAIQRTDAISENVSSVWTGDAANRYQKKINKLSTKIKKRANALETNAAGLKSSATRLKRAEEYAQSLFSKK